MTTLHFGSGCTEFVEDSCIICKSVCMKKLIGHEGQISAEDLFFLLDTPNKGINKSYFLSTCATCSKLVGKLQGMCDTLIHIQNAVKQLQIELATKIISCSPEEEEEDDDDIRVLSPDANVAAQDTLYNICKRWRHKINEINSPSKDLNSMRTLMGITAKIPEGLIIRPAGESSSSLSQENNDYDQQQQQVVQVQEQVDEIPNALNNNDDSNSSSISPAQPPVQFHLDLNDFENLDGVGAEDDDDTQSQDYADDSNNSSKVIDFVTLQDDDSESDNEENEVNAEDLIPAVQLSTYSASEHGSSSELLIGTPPNFTIADQSSEIYLPPSISVSRSLNVDTQLNPDIQLSPATPTYYDTNGYNESYEDSMLSTLPVGQAAVSPGSYETRGGARNRRAKTISKTIKAINPLAKSQVFRCTQCPRSFSNREEFRMHLEIHKETAPTCEVCNKVFPRRHNLIIHMRTHTGDKPYSCPVCRQRYSDRSNYNAHVRKHIQRPFGCIVCLRVFKTSQEAQSHATCMHPNEARSSIISKVTVKKKK